MGVRRHLRDRGRSVHVDVEQVRGGVDRDLNALVLLQRVGLLRREIECDLVRTALHVQELSRSGHVANHDRLELRLRAPETRIRVEDDLLVGAELLEDVGAAAGRGAVEVLLGLVLLVGADSVGATWARTTVELRMPRAGLGRMKGIEGFGTFARSTTVDGLGAETVIVASRKDGVALEVDQPSEGEDHVGRGERRAVGEGNAFVEVEGEELGVGRGVIGGGEPGNGLLARALERDEGVVHGMSDDRSGRVELPLRVGRANHERVVDHQRPAGAGRVGCGDPGHGRRKRDDRHDEDRREHSTWSTRRAPPGG